MPIPWAAARVQRWKRKVAALFPKPIMAQQTGGWSWAFDDFSQSDLLVRHGPWVWRWDLLRFLQTSTLPYHQVPTYRFKEIRFKPSFGHIDHNYSSIGQTLLYFECHLSVPYRYVSWRYALSVATFLDVARKKAMWTREYAWSPYKKVHRQHKQNWLSMNTGKLASFMNTVCGVWVKH